MISRRKRVCLIILLIFSIVLVSCSCGLDQPSSYERNEVIQGNQLKQLQVPASAQILLFTGDDIVYSVEETTSNPERPSQLIYRYDLITEKSVQMDKVYFPEPSTNSVVTIGDIFYMICAPENNNTCEIRAFDLTMNSSQVIYQWDSNTIFAYLYAVNQNLILFDIAALDDLSTRYSITVFEISDYSSQTIVSKTFCNSSGTAISCIDTDKELIYSYQVNIDEGRTNYMIVAYDLTGEVAEEHLLDLSGFLSNDDAETIDGVVRMKKAGDYYIINTVNRRIRILQQNDQGLLPISLPDEGFEGNERFGQYALVESFGERDEIYFSNYGAEPSVYSFNAKTGEFVHYSLPGISDYSHYYSNSNRLLIKEREFDENGMNYRATFYIMERVDTY